MVKKTPLLWLLPPKLLDEAYKNRNFAQHSPRTQNARLTYNDIPQKKRTHHHMEHLPKDPFMLVSCINMLLRDHEFESLEALCDNFNRDPKEIKSYLQEHGYIYSEEQRQMRPIGYDS